MESFNELQSFARARQRLIEKLDEQRGDLDSWLEEHVGPAKGLSMRDLANLAALVQLRRDALMELVELDDAMLQRILDRRNEESSGQT